MFNSTGNNFGAGVINFKEAREDGYIVLNAKFSCSPAAAAYRAADVLEIYVPGLNIFRSTESAVVVRFKDRRANGSNYDGGTFARSWIRDSRTICIEKLPVFDEFDEILIYIQALYCQLAQGANAIKGTRRAITAHSEGDYLSFDYDNICVVFNRWIFFHMYFRSCAYAYRDLDWEAFFDGLPEDVAADIPVIANSNYNHPNLGSVTESRVDEGYWNMPASERGVGFLNSSSKVFSFAYLVRDVVPDIAGRLRIEEASIKGDGYVQMTDFGLELSAAPALTSVYGKTGQYGSTQCKVYPKAVPDGMPEFRAFLLATNLSGNMLCVHLVSMKLSGVGTRPQILFSAMSGENKLTIKIRDISVAVAI